MIRKLAKKFSSVRMQLVASVFVAIAPVLVFTYLVNQSWFWQFAPDWMKQYATDVPWVSLTVGFIALIAAWFGGEHFILRQVRALSDTAEKISNGDFSARTGLKASEDELGQLAKIFDSMAVSLEERVAEREKTEKLLLHRALQQTVIAALGQFALTNNDLEALQEQAVMLVAQTLEVEYTAVLKRLTDGQLLLQAGVGWKRGNVGSTKLSGDTRSQIGFTLNSGEPVIIADSKTETQFAAPPFLSEHGVVSGVTIAIPTRTQPFGVLGVHTTRRREFTSDEVQFLLAVANAIGIAADRLNLEEQLRQSQKMESIGQLASGVAHDFNNMLTIIQGHSSSLLARPTLPSELLEPVQAVYFAAERAAGLTRQLLMFSRKNVMQPKPLDLREVVGNMTKMLGRLLGETIALEFEPPARLPLVQGDSGMIEQVVMNLAVNARDAMPKNGKLIVAVEPVFVGAVYAEMHPDARSGNFIRLRVADNGCGMDAATMSRIFEPFFTTKEVGKGTGLGLATVYGIVKQHEGWIEVNSEPGKGTTFDVFFPATDEMASDSKIEIRSTSPVAGGTETILIVEDEPILREMARDILATYGYQIIEASSGREAFDVWGRRTGTIDLLLTDMVMPEGVSGVDLAEKLLAEKPDLKIIFTSGYTANEISSAMLEKTRANFLQKPYAHKDLARTVRDCLDKTAAHSKISA
jgi:signal transduction histidine kinase/ActR/RegA family two-component response regulator/HAMP domain-containing protein